MAREKRSSGGPGSPAALRRRNLELIKQALLVRGGMTQAKLSRVTGLSTGTISNLVRVLEAQGNVTTAPTIENGRRAQRVALNRREVVAGIAVNRGVLNANIVSFAHEVLAEKAQQISLEQRPEATLQQAQRMMEEMLSSLGATRAEVAGIGISVPFVLGQDSTVMDPEEALGRWRGVNVQGLSSEVFDRVCTVDNDANAGAIAQVTFGPFGDVRHLTYVKIDAGIGAGFWLNGQQYRGAIGTAGEIGHMNMESPGERCRCGNRGCLETVASVTVMQEKLGKALHLKELSSEQMLELLRDRDQAALRIVNNAGQYIGQSLATLCNVMSPEVIVVGSPLAPAGAKLLDPIYRGLHRSAIERVTQHTRLVANQLGPRTETLGMVAEVLRASEIR